MTVRSERGDVKRRRRNAGNGGRTYDASNRQAEAARTRQRIVAAATDRFLGDGYGPATVAGIAAQAGVSVDTVYKSFGGKAGLVHAIWRRALEGSQPVPAEERSEALQAAEADPHRIIQGWGRFLAELSPRAAPIMLLIRAAAATHPEAAALWDEIESERLARMTANARRLRDNGHLRPGITLKHAADVLWACSAPDVYELLVLRRGWSPEAFGRFAADTMIAALL